MNEAFQSASWHRVANLKPRLRPHGEIQPHRYRRQTWYVLHDPASGRVHRFTPIAYSFIRELDGERTIDLIWTEMASHLEEHAPTQDEIIRLLSQLFEADMLQLDTLPDADAFMDLVRRQQRTKLLNIAKNPLSVTFPLWDPDSFLSKTIAPARAFIRSSWGIAAWSLWVLPAVILAALHFSELSENLSDRVLSTEGLLLMALTFPVVKVLHELGHAYALKVFGGEVHQIGLMLIALYPVPYVDASSAAMLPNKWKRIVVGAAGMMVELLIAALAMYLWLLVEPGLVRSIAFDVILIAGVSTIVVNGNPLLRFDGYFILSDWLEIPNLAQRCGRYWNNLGLRMFGLRSAMPAAIQPDERAWFIFYGPASYCYRVMVLFSLGLFVASEYLIFGVMLALSALVTAFVIPLSRGVRQLLNVAQVQSEGRKVRTRLVLATSLSAVAIFVVPIPLHTNAEGITWLPEDAYVRAGADGFVDRVVANVGVRTQKGMPLVESYDAFLNMQIDQRRHRVRELETKFVSERFVDRALAKITEMELGEEKLRLNADLEKLGRLIAKGDREGTFLLPLPQDMPGRFYRKGETLAYVVPDQIDTIRVVVLQDNIDLVRHQLQHVRLKLANELHVERKARIVREVPAAADESPSKALLVSGGGAIAGDPKDPKSLKAARRIFQFDLELAQPLSAAALGGRAYVRFEHVPEPLAWQAYRRVRQLFLSRFNA